MSRRGSAFIILVMLGFFSCQTGPDKILQQDWADITFYATGVGPTGTGSPPERIRAIQAAKKDAARQLEAKVLAHQTDKGKPLFEQVQKGDSIKKLSAFVRGAEIISVEYKEDGVHMHTRLFLGNHFKATMGLLPPKALRPSNAHPMESY